MNTSGQEKSRGQLNKDIQVVISENAMSAMVCLVTLGNPDVGFTYNEVLEALTKAGVRMGIQEDKIYDLLENKRYDVTVQVAEGKMAENGRDGKYELFFNTELDSKPVVREDGTVDYYNMKLFEMVHQGDKLAEYIPPTKGIFGYDVRGRLLTPKRGRPQSPLRGKGFTVSGDGAVYYAELDGKVEYCNKDLNVVNMLQISGNVDLNVGNVSFNGDVNIDGSVITGLTVKATGSIYIGGYIEGAVIRAERDIVLREGVNGKNVGRIEAGGNISAKFFENVTVAAKGDIHAGYIVNSTVTADGKVVAEGSRGTIRGGDITGVKGVDAGSIGNDSYAPTVVRVGPTKTVRMEYAELIMKLREVCEQIDMYQQAMEKLDKIKNVCPEKYDAALYKRVFQSKIIKSAERAKYDEQAKRLYELIREAGKSVIRVNGVLYPGVKMVIDGKPFELETELKHLLVRKFNDTIVVRDYGE